MSTKALYSGRGGAGFAHGFRDTDNSLDCLVAAGFRAELSRKQRNFMEWDASAGCNAMDPGGVAQQGVNRTGPGETGNAAQT